ncbi:HDOD domain-containing protein [Alteromonas aestuariivivens]|uniref:HDOD domain-containing protein n=1 Tax=Alteromonas aestuariivivens TaxID=1938339 RepID=A0A3D8M474_9ALTE|nr:HDOD domain-containing protein [Alteromonas aestuariivivens]RDV24380.1 HDOD domain-containing protein [Alteromonas aestuariivivens]
MKRSDYPTCFGLTKQLLVGSGRPDDVTETSQPTVPLCRHLASSLLSFGIHHPDEAVAVLNSVPPAASVQKVFNHLLLLTLFGQRLQFNERYLCTLVSALAFSYAQNYHSETSSGTPVGQLHKQETALWHEVVQLRRLIAHPTPVKALGPPRLSDSQRWILISLVMLSGSPDQNLFELITILPVRFQKSLAHLIAYPLGSMVGMTVKADSTRWLVVSQTDEKTYRIAQLHSANMDSIRSVHREQIECLGPASFKQWQNKNQLAHREFERPSQDWPVKRAYKINSPPIYLRTIISLLQDDNANIDTIASKIIQHTELADFLMSSASRDNRLQLAVNDIKQAIMTFGLERISDMLIQRALSTRLHQKYFPLRTVCAHLETIIAGVASQLAALSPHKVSPQNTSLLATFSTAPLFTLPALKLSKTIQVSNKNTYDINTLALQHHTQTIGQMAVELARGWQQSDCFIGILSQWGKLPSHCPKAYRVAYSILIISVCWSRKWLFGIHGQCPQTDIAVQEALSFSGLNNQTEMIVLATMSHLVFSPEIDGKLSAISRIYSGNSVY